MRNGNSIQASCDLLETAHFLKAEDRLVSLSVYSSIGVCFQGEGTARWQPAPTAVRLVVDEHSSLTY